VWTWEIDGASTNQQTGDTADANGNIGSGYIYDLDNQLVQPGSSSAARYAYDAGNKRVWRGDTGVDEVTFWAGQKLAIYQISTSGGLSFTLTSTNVYFCGKLISKGTYNSSGSLHYVNLAPVAADRLGSIGKFYPYGQERPLGYRQRQGTVHRLLPRRLNRTRLRRSTLRTAGNGKIHERGPSGEC
jgi:hypothetical protein